MKWNFAYYNVYALTKRYIRTLLAFNSLSFQKKNSLFCFSFFLFLKNKNKNKNLFFFNYKCTLTCTFTLFFINIINMHFTTIYYPLLLFRRYLCWWARAGTIWLLDKESQWPNHSEFGNCLCWWDREGTIWSPASDTRNCRWRDQNWRERTIWLSGNGNKKQCPWPKEAEVSGELQNMRQLLAIVLDCGVSWYVTKSLFICLLTSKISYKHHSLERNISNSSYIFEFE